MNKRYYKAELLIEDTFEDEELDENGNAEMPTSEIAKFLDDALPYGFKIVKKSMMKVENLT